VELRADGSVALAARPDKLIPSNAKRSDVRRILDAAAEHFEELVIAWESMQ
jgi:hypothetical protein